MNKKILIFLSILAFIAIVVIAGGYYFYKNPVAPIDNNNQTNSNTSNPSDSQQEQQANNQQGINQPCESDSCEEVMGEIIDGVIKTMNEDSIEVERDDTKAIEKIMLSNDTSYYLLTFSSDFSNVDETEIEKKDVKMGSNVSVSVKYFESSPDIKTAAAIKSIVVDKEE